MKFRDLKLGVKQWLGVGAMLVAMASVSFFSIDRMSGLREEIDELNGFWIPDMTALSEIILDVSNLRILQLELALNDFDPAGVSGTERAVAWFDSIEANITGLEYRDSMHEDRYSNERRVLLKAFDENWDAFQLHYMNLFDAVSDEEAARQLEIAGRRFDDITEHLEELIDLSTKSSAEAALRARTSYERTRQVIVTVLLLTIIGSALVAGALIRSLTRPIRKLEAAAEAVAGGDLSVRIDVESDDEIGRLSRSFNNMTASLSSAQQQLIMKEKMASLGQLTAGIAHEIKNPLNFVNNFAVLTRDIAGELVRELAENADRPVREVIDTVSDLLEDLRFNTGKIAEHGARADGIVHSMLQHSRGRPGERQTVELNPFLDEYVNLAFHGMRASTPDFKTNIERSFDPAVGALEIVPQDLGRVFINLLNNAFQAVHERAQADPSHEPRVRVETRRERGEVVVAISDNGPGIPEALRRRIFDPFFTTKPTGQGTGLGLSLSYEIVTQGHGGTMQVQSREGEGATFIIRLPAT